MKDGIFKYVTENILKIDNLEIFKPYYIEGNITNYRVTDSGEVYSIRKNGKIIKLTPQRQKSGYYLVHLTYNGKNYYRWLHRMVAECYIPNPENKPQVNHKDGNKSNNSVYNLEWMTSKENVEHAFKTSLRKFGEGSSNSKITENDAIKICEMLEDNQFTMQEIAEIIGCSYATVYQIHKKLTWVAISSSYNIDNFNKFTENHSNSSLSRETVMNICEDLQNTLDTYKIIGAKYNISPGIVECIKRGITWKTVSKNYDFSIRDIYAKHK